MSLGPLQLSSSTMDHEGQMETNNQAGVTKEEKTKGDLEEEEETFAAIHVTRELLKVQNNHEEGKDRW